MVDNLSINENDVINKGKIIDTDNFTIDTDNSTMDIDNSIVEEIRCRVYSFIESSADWEWELEHVINVEEAIIMLSEKRKLDKNICILMALLHDIARIKDGVLKNHAKYGAELAYSFLTEMGLDERTAKLISSSVKEHSKKSSIGDVYSEIIKDADTIAHIKEYIESTKEHDKDTKEYDNINDLDERIKALHGNNVELDEITNIYELERYLNIQRSGITINLNNSLENKFQASFNYELSKFYRLVLKSKEDMSDAETVHDLRVCLKTLSMFYKMLDEEDKNQLKQLIKLNRLIFKRLGALRFIDVFIDFVMDNNECVYILDRLKRKKQREIIKLNKFMMDKIKLQDLDSIIVFAKEHKYNYSNLERRVKCEIERYVKKLFSASLKDITSIHNLRLAGKNLKYLCGLGLLDIDEYTHKQIKVLHDEAGGLNDIIEFKDYIIKLMKSSKKEISKEKLENILQIISEKEKSQRKKIKLVLFRLRLRFYERQI